MLASFVVCGRSRTHTPCLCVQGTKPAQGNLNTYSLLHLGLLRTHTPCWCVQGTMPARSHVCVSDLTHTHTTCLCVQGTTPACSRSACLATTAPSRLQSLLCGGTSHLVCVRVCRVRRQHVHAQPAPQLPHPADCGLWPSGGPARHLHGQPAGLHHPGGPQRQAPRHQLQRVLANQGADLCVAAWGKLVWYLHEENLRT